MKTLYVGILLIPITYALGTRCFTQDLVGRFIYFLGVVGYLEIPSLLLFALGMAFSPFLRFFVGSNTSVLDNAKLPLGTIFSYEIEYFITKNVEPKIIEKIIHGTGFTTSRRSRPLSDDVGWIICEKEQQNLGIFYETKERIFSIIFLSFEAVNDTVKRFEDMDAVLDLKAQIMGLLNNWVERKKILQCLDITTTTKMENVLVKISEGPEPIKIAPIGEIKQIIKYPIQKLGTHA